MKRYRFHIAVLIIFSVLALFLNEYRRGSTLGSRETAFAITSKGRVEGIDITDGEGGVTLQKSDGEWVLNSRYDARARAVDLLLQTLERIRVAAPAPLRINEKLTGMSSDEFARVVINTGGRQRSFLLYSEGPGHQTYILREGSSKAFVAEVLGFEGDVMALFITDEGYWRTNVLFNYPPDRIAEVLVQHSDSSSKAFLLRQHPGEGFSLFSYPGEEEVEGFSDSLVVRYLTNYFYVPYERVANPEEMLLVDSLAKAMPDHYIRVTGFDGSVTGVGLYRIINHYQAEEVREKYDPFRLHALINEKTEMIIVTWHSVDLLLRSSTYFFL